MGRLLKNLSLFFLILGPIFNLYGQDSLFVLRPSDVSEAGFLRLPNITAWEFKKGNDSSRENAFATDTGWTKLDSVEIANLEFDEDGKFEGWFRFRFKMEGEFKVHPFFIVSNNLAAQTIYLDGKFIGSFGNIGENSSDFRMRSWEQYVFLPINIGESHQIAVHFVDRERFNIRPSVEFIILDNYSFLFFTDSETVKTRQINFESGKYSFIIGLTMATLILLVTFFITLLNRSERHLRYTAYFSLSIFCFILFSFLSNYSTNPSVQDIAILSNELAILGMFVVLPILCSQIFYNRIPKWVNIITISTIVIYSASFYRDELVFIPVLISVLGCIFIVFKSRKSISIPKWAIVSGLIGTPLCLIIISIMLQFSSFLDTNDLGYFMLFSLSLFPLSLLAYIVLWLRDSVTKEKEKAAQVIALTEEKRLFLEDQNIKLEQQVSKRTKELNDSLVNLKATQSQLIQSEKMASLGELTAGIAHEIQNPLNFVNNFSEVNSELIEEQKEELSKGNFDEAKKLANEIGENEKKIVHHGKRADAIVKGMLQHSKGSSGTKEPTDINALCDEYLRLAYHGLRAKDKSFNAKFETDFDTSLEKINVVPQDIGRVVLNLITNAFYAVNEISRASEDTSYEPTVVVSTKKDLNKVLITVKDNGAGIPEQVRDKIFQPFFTTKPTGQGTGLGLSLSYDIVKAHGGELRVESKENEGSEFFIILPIQ